MTLFSIILILVLLFSLASKKDSIEKIKITFALDCVIFCFINIGHFVKIGSLPIEYDYVVVTVLTMQILSLKSSAASTSGAVGFAIMFMIAIFAGLLMQHLYPTTTGVYVVGGNEERYAYFGEKWLPVVSWVCIKPLIRLVIFFFDAAVLSSCFSRQDWLDVSKKICFYSIPFLIFISFEVICRNILHNTAFDAITRILFSAETGGWKVERGDLMAVMGFRGECTTLASGLFEIGLIAIIAFKSTLKNKYMYLVLWILVLLLVSGAMVGILAMAVLGIILLYEQVRQNKRSAIFLEIFLVIVLLFCIRGFDVSYIMSRIQGAINVLDGEFSRAFTDGSSAVRMLSIVDGIKAFLERPLVGVGLDTVVVYGATVLGLAEMGLLGVLFWILFVKTCSGINFRQNFLFILALTAVYTFSGDRGVYYDLTLFLVFQCLALNNLELKDRRNCIA